MPKGRKRTRIKQTKAIKRYYSTIYVRGYNAGRKLAEKDHSVTVPTAYSNMAIVLTGISCLVFGLVIGLIL